MSLDGFSWRCLQQRDVRENLAPMPEAVMRTTGDRVSGTTCRKIDKSAATVHGRCACGSVRLEIDYPAFWAWHDHSRATQHAHGAAYATYVGVWRSRFRFTRGDDHIVRFEDKARQTARSFCTTCGTPLLYERSHSP